MKLSYRVLLTFMFAFTAGCASQSTSSQLPQAAVPVFETPLGASMPHAVAPGTLFINVKTASSVEVIAAPYTGVPHSTSTGLVDAQSMAIDSRNHLFVSNGNSTIVEFAPSDAP